MGNKTTFNQLYTADCHPAYRPDIDGLRAVAVLSVVIFHVFPTFLTGGFVGVDVFFVISGFLISSIIFKSLLQESFSFTEFYARRIKRIFPALILVLVSTYILGWFVLLPDEFKQLGKHMVASVGFIQNAVLWNEVGYFDIASELKPLLHLWSLAIEEQFYLIYPLVIWGAWRLRINVLAILMICCLLSFSLNVDGVNKDTIKTFYLPHTRFWELLSGAVLAYFQMFNQARLTEWLTQRNVPISIYHWFPLTANGRVLIKHMLSILGLFLIGTAVVVLSKDKLFPGWWALLPVVGAICIILSGPNAWVSRQILASRVMVFVGLISYPLYLWHWALLSFARIVGTEIPSIDMRFIVILSSFILAWLTYLLLEQPVRFGRKIWIKTAILCAMAAAVGYVGFKTFEQNGFSFRMADRQSFADYFDNSRPEFRYTNRLGMNEKYRDECNFYNIQEWTLGRPTALPRTSIADTCFVPKSSTSIFIWGDSHAQQFYYGLKQVLPESLSILQVASSGCPAQVGEKAKSEPEYCRKSNEFALKVIRERTPKIVVIAQETQHDQRNNLKEITAVLKKLGVSSVIVLGPVPKWDPFLYKLILKDFWYNTPRRIFKGTKKDDFDIDTSMKMKYSKNEGEFRYVSMVDYFCNQDGCITYVGNDRREGLVTFDYGHLSPAASLTVASELLKPIIEHTLKSIPRHK